MRSQAWVPQKVEIFEWWEAENSVPNMWGLGNWDILSDEWGKLREEWWVMSDGFFKTKQPLIVQLIGTLCFKQEHPIFNLPIPKTDLSKTKVIKFYFI